LFSLNSKRDCLSLSTKRLHQWLWDEVAEKRPRHVVNGL
jgi:hypothetical protein